MRNSTHHRDAASTIRSSTTTAIFDSTKVTTRTSVAVSEPNRAALMTKTAAIIAVARNVGSNVLSAVTDTAAPLLESIENNRKFHLTSRALRSFPSSNERISILRER